MTKNIAVSLLFSLATIALLGYIWFGQTTQRLEATNNREVAQRLEFGQRNYEQYCATCHGLAGEGGGARPDLGAPALSTLQTLKGPGTAAYTDTNGIQKKYGSLLNYVEATIANGIRGTAMPAWKVWPCLISATPRYSANCSATCWGTCSATAGAGRGRAVTSATGWRSTWWRPRRARGAT